MSDLSDRFERLGLSQYLETFVSEGFDSWETVLDITESDLASLNVKLGHRRKLQRAIAEARGQPPDRALNLEPRKSQGGDSAYRSDDSAAEPRDANSRTTHGSATAAASGSNTGTKRKYRRHPKPDVNAPERPPSAYVIFSNQVREELKGQDLSFTEIAKVVGERWQVLPANYREACEQQANAAKEKYYAELAEYKRTPKYAEYQEYLVEFKAKHGQSRTEGKRSKLESETSPASLPTENSIDSLERSHSTRSAPTLSLIPRSSGSSPPSAGGLPAQSAFRRPSSSSSPALHSEAVSSPAKADPYSPRASSPVSSSTHPSKHHRGQARAAQTEARARDQTYSSNMPLTQAYSGYRPTESWPDNSSNQASHYTALPRRTSRESPVGPPPPLVRQESTLSSLESVSGLPPTISLLPGLDVSKSSRTLPQPVMVGSHRPSLLDQKLAPMPMSSSGDLRLGASQSRDSQRASNWPALLRATELAREADMEGAVQPKDSRDESP